MISIDPIYQFDEEEIQKRFDESAETVIRQVVKTPENWVWSYHKGSEDLLANRKNVLELFLKDLSKGVEQGRYVYGSFPDISLESGKFDLALCSHFLFLYSDHFDYEFHIKSIREMLRLANDVRIFPLLTLVQDYSPYVDRVIAELEEEGYFCSIEKVDYELQKGGNKMLRITSASSSS